MNQSNSTFTRSVVTLEEVYDKLTDIIDNGTRFTSIEEKESSKKMIDLCLDIVDKISRTVEIDDILDFDFNPIVDRINDHNNRVYQEMDEQQRKENPREYE